MPSPLQLTAGQSQIISDIDQYLQSAFLSGVENSSLTIIVPGITNYNDLTSPQQLSVKDIFKAVVAAFVYTANIPAELPASTFSGTVVLAQLTSLGSQGSLSFVNGYCTSYTPPT